jgi:hypothetical protein
VVDAFVGRDVGVVAAAGDDYVAFADGGAAGRVDRAPGAGPVVDPGVALG